MRYYTAGVSRGQNSTNNLHFKQVHAKIHYKRRTRAIYMLKQNKVFTD